MGVVWELRPVRELRPVWELRPIRELRPVWELRPVRELRPVVGTPPPPTYRSISHLIGWQFRLCVGGWVPGQKKNKTNLPKELAEKSMKIDANLMKHLRKLHENLMTT